MTERSNLTRWVAALGICLVFAVHVWLRRWNCDDAFIIYRVARNWVEGFGPVYNVGERVEATTSPAWLAAVSLGTWLGIRPERVGIGLGIGMSVLAPLFAQVASVRALPDDESAAPNRSWVLPFGILVYVALPVAWDFGTSGLEQPLVTLWLAVAMVFGAERSRCDAAGSPEASRRFQDVLACAWWGLGPLIRPELGLYSLAWLGWFVWRSEGGERRPRWILALGPVAAGLVLPVAYEIFRAGYYAALVPTPALTKEAGMAAWHRGMWFLLDLVLTYHLWAPLLGLVALAVVRGRLGSFWVVSLAVAALHTLYVVRLGGGFMHGRMLLAPLFVACVPLAAVRLDPSERLDLSAWRTKVGLLGTFLVVAWSVGMVAMPPRHGGRSRPHPISDERAHHIAMAWKENPVYAEDYAGDLHYQRAAALADAIDRRCGVEDSCPPVVLVEYPPFGAQLLVRARIVRARNVPPGVAAVTIGRRIGVYGYVAGPRVRVVDVLGLADPYAARVTIVDRAKAGHEKFLPPLWVYARYGELSDEVPPSPELDAIRRAQACPALQELEFATTAPLDPARFFRNMGAARRLHRLRFDARPDEAVRSLCRGP